MSITVRGVERDQLWLMPPSVRYWLPEDHLAWFVLDVIEELDLAEFRAAYRADGRGGAVYDPALVLGVLFYAYAVGEHSSRRIERRLVEDVAFRVVAANQQPDHATLAQFRARHQDAIAELFAQVLGLCVADGLVAAGTVAIDGTKIEANASAWSNRTRRQSGRASPRLSGSTGPKTPSSVSAAAGSYPSDGRHLVIGGPGFVRHSASSTSGARRTGRATRPSGPPRRRQPGASSRAASPNRAAPRARRARPTRPTRTVGCCEPGTGSCRAREPGHVRTGLGR